MNARRPTPISDAQIRDALAGVPDTQRMVDDLAAIVAAAERTRQGRASPNRWLLVAAALVVVGMLVLLAVALAVGSRQHVLPPTGLARTGLVAFDVDGDIWVASADGTGRRQMTSGPAVDFEPLWSPDGTKLVFWSADQPAPGNSTSSGNCGCSSVPDAPRRLMLLDMSAPSSAGASVVTTVSSLGDWRPSWAPDSRRLAYADSVSGAFTIFVVGLDAPSPVRIGPFDMDGWDPAWSPDGRLIAFQGGRADPQRGLYVMGADGSAVRRLTTIPSRGKGFLIPVWSPAGDRLAFAAETAGSDLFQRDIWVVGLTGAAEVDISNDPADESKPGWSPDGAFVGYLRIVDVGRHTYHLVATRADGTPGMTFPVDVGEGTVDWSPDATRILAYVVNPDTGDFKQVIVVDGQNGRSVVVAEGHTTSVGSWQRLAP